MFYLSSITLVNSIQPTNIFLMKIKYKTWVNEFKDITLLKGRLEVKYNPMNISFDNAIQILSKNKYSKNQYKPKVFKVSNAVLLDGIEEDDSGMED